jgi:hypothetical protein
VRLCRTRGGVGVVIHLVVARRTVKTAVQQLPFPLTSPCTFRGDSLSFFLGALFQLLDPAPLAFQLPLQPLCPGPSTVLQSDTVGTKLTAHRPAHNHACGRSLIGFPPSPVEYTGPATPLASKALQEARGRRRRHACRSGWPRWAGWSRCMVAGMTSPPAEAKHQPPVHLSCASPTLPTLSSYVRLTTLLRGSGMAYTSCTDLCGFWTHEAGSAPVSPQSSRMYFLDSSST